MSAPPPPVTFDVAKWKGMYPEFAAATDPQAEGWFTRATFIVGNDWASPANRVAGMLESLLYLLTAHIAWLNMPRDAAGNFSSTGSASQLVGRIDSASEGSVSVHADLGGGGDSSPSQWWYMQSRYGAEYWAATAGFRTAHYVPRPAPWPYSYRRRPGF